MTAPTTNSRIDSSDWRKPLRRLCAACGVTATTELADAWYSVLGEFSPEIFAAAVDDYLKTATDSRMPMPGVLRRTAGTIADAILKQRIADAPPCPMKCENGWLAVRDKSTGERIPSTVVCRCIRGARHSGMPFNPRTMETEYRFAQRTALPGPAPAIRIPDFSVPPAHNKPAAQQKRELSPKEQT